ncbi:MAG: undecaprenyl-phosphate glucose phosphotransferase [Candidatus Aminicenantes bacterium]|nr:undecaprenyl-phosphate glucose phosphotransferase [Candidatus Aminicenantes bacterium]
MIKKRRKQLVYFYSISDIAAIILSFHLTFWLRFDSGLIPVPKGVPGFGKYLIIIPFLLLVHIVHFSYQGYYKIRLRRNRLDDLFLVVLNTIVSAFLIIFIFSYLSRYGHVDFEISHVFLMLYTPIAITAIFSLRMIIFKVFRGVFLKRNGVSKVLIAGTGELAKTTAGNLKKYDHFGIRVAGFLADKKNDRVEVLGNFKDLEKVVKREGITDLVIALSSKEYKAIMSLIETANNLMIEVRMVPDFLQMFSLKAGMEHIEGIPIINLGDIPLRGWQLLFKRVFDFVSSLVGFILISPVFLLLAILIKVTSRGPVFYKQTRVGIDGKIFKMIKFRTMVVDAEKKTGAIWSPRGDKRVTSIGGVLRKFSIDELPQLINVIKGDMSLVGPRPERPELVDKFKDHIPRYMLRHSVKTGMTGWAQVHGLRGNTPLDKRIEYDIYYIRNWSFRLDFEILWRTFLKFQFIDRNN